MEAETWAEAASNLRQWGGAENGRGRSVLILLATLMATLVLGYTPDLCGLVSWFRTYNL